MAPLDDAPNSQVSRAALMVRRGREHRNYLEINKHTELLIKLVAFLEAYTAAAAASHEFRAMSRDAGLVASLEKEQSNTGSGTLDPQEWLELKKSVEPAAALIRQAEGCPFPEAIRTNLLSLYTAFETDYEKKLGGKGWAL